MHTALLLAGGKGRRTQGRWDDKIQAPLEGRPVFAWTVNAFVRSKVIDALVIVVRDAEQQSALAAIARTLTDLPIIFTDGGNERQDSVRNGLRFAPKDTETVLIHDAARPLVLPADIARLVDHVRSTQRGACLAHRVTDTIKRTPGNASGGLLEDLDRTRLWGMETPQVFPYWQIHDAYESVAREGVTITDDAAAAVHAGHPVDLIEASAPNPKLTRSEDLAWITFLLHNEPIYATLWEETRHVD